MIAFGRVSPWIVAAVLALVAALAAALTVLHPERAVVWMGSAFWLPAAWLVLALARRTRFGGSLERDGLGYTGALTVAGVIMAAALGFTLAESVELVGESTTSRGMGVVIGLFLVLVGNAMPKILQPLAKTRCDPSRVQSLQRFAGWTFVLAGIAYASAFLVLPPDRAAMVSGIVAGGAVALVGAPLAWFYLRRGLAAGAAKG